MAEEIIIREHAPGRWIVGRPTVRDGRVHVTGRTRWMDCAEKALEKARSLLEAQDTLEPSEASETKRARHSQARREPKPDRLKPQARQILHHLILRRGLTARQAMQITPPCYRLAARIREIRDEFGDDAVETVRVRGASYCRYVWRGPDAIQIEMEGAA